MLYVILEQKRSVGKNSGNHTQKQPKEIQINWTPSKLTCASDGTIKKVNSVQNGKNVNHTAEKVLVSPLYKELLQQ